jgi:hypothetical protein
LSRERAIKNCVSCFELSRSIILTQPDEDMKLKGSLELITLYNNAMKAAEAVKGPAGKDALKACTTCNFTEPKIANMLRKAVK